MTSEAKTDLIRFGLIVVIMVLVSLVTVYVS